MGIRMSRGPSGKERLQPESTSWRWLRHFVALGVVLLTGLSVFSIAAAIVWDALAPWLGLPVAALMAGGGAWIVVDLEGE
jgi:hypothetical protein